MFASGLAMLLAIANVHFRDTKHFVAIALQMWMYLTPIIYPIELVQSAAERHPWIAMLYDLNPMQHFVTVFRNLLYDNRFPAADEVLWCAGTAGVVFGVAFAVFAKTEKRLAELL